MLGPGLRYQLSPNQSDNDLRLQLLGRVGYRYIRDNGDTHKVNGVPVASLPQFGGNSYIQPHSSWTYGVKVRIRHDGLCRNLLELPHKGLAAGFDLDYIHRANWDKPYGTTAVTRNPGDTRNYAQFSGYLMGAIPLPGLSEKDIMGATSR